ncbi:MAG: DUF1566 domain-containing protein [Candidatus Binatia bacterium]
MNRNITIVASLLTALLAGVQAAQAAGTPIQACAAARINASGKYTACQAKALAKFETSSDYDALRAASSKCNMKYAAVWPKLQNKFAGSFTACDQNRYTDNGATVTDNLTGLVWEKKTDDSSVHDVDNSYTWTWAGDLDETNADGTAFDVFIWDTAGSCFQGNCDWRMPTREELQTIIAEAYPCTTSPCIAATFGLTQSSFYLTASSAVSDLTGTGVWAVNFADGGMTVFGKTGAMPTRAVRGGF